MLIIQSGFTGGFLPAKMAGLVRWPSALITLKQVLELSVARDGEDGDHNHCSVSTHPLNSRHLHAIFHILQVLDIAICYDRNLHKRCDKSSSIKCCTEEHMDMDNDEQNK